MGRGKTIGPNGDKCGERPCKEVESPYKELYTSVSLVLTDGCRSFEAVHCGFSHLSGTFLLFLKPMSLPLAKIWDSNLLRQNRISKHVEFKLNSPNGEEQQASGAITEDLNSMLSLGPVLKLQKENSVESDTKLTLPLLALLFHKQAT